MLFEPLESRTLLSAVGAIDANSLLTPNVSLRVVAPPILIPNLIPRDVFFDSTRNQLLVAPYNHEGIDRYDASSGQFISTISLPASSRGTGDITPDGRLLYLTAYPSMTVYKIDLSTETYTTIPMGQHPDEVTGDLAISNNSATITSFSSNINFHNRIRSLDLDDDSISDLLFNSARLNSDRYVLVARSADYKHTFLATPNAEYEVGGGQNESRDFGDVFNLAVSPDGALHAVSSTNGLFIINSSFEIVAKLDFSGFYGVGLTFDPVRDLLYVADPMTDSIHAFDTRTWDNLFDLPIGEDLRQADQNGLGSVVVSPDGNSIFVVTDSGVRMFQTSAIYGTSLIFTATVTGASPDAPTPTGSVKLSDALTGSFIAEVALDNGAGQIGYQLLHSGAHSIIASYDGDASYEPAVSEPVPVTVRRAPTSISVNTDISFGTAIVNVSSPQIGVDAGHLDVFEGPIKLATSDVVAGIAKFTTPTTGTHTLTLNYSGNDDFLPTTLSVQFNVRVQPTLTLSGPSSSLWGKIVYLSADIPASFDTALASGQVTFYDGGQEFAGFPMVHGHALFGGAIEPGRHTITAKYSGNEDFFSATSNPISLTVRAGKTTIKLSTTTSYIPNTTRALLSATVSSPTFTSTPSGKITFKEGKRILGTANIIGDTATLTRSLSPGLHKITATYAGNAINDPGTSNSVKINVFPVTTIDLMVVYTPAAANGAGSTSQINDLINESVLGTNEAFSNSHIPVVLRLVYSGSIQYRESGDFENDLRRLTRPHDGFMDSVHALRNTYGADLVSLFESDGDLGGVAWELRDLDDSTNSSSAFSVVLTSQAADPYYTLAHELGHNLGATHDAQHAEGPGATKFSNGWRFRGKDGVLYHDIMSYDPGRTIPYFSNPRIKYQGVLIGNAQTADSARTITITAPYVAAYRRGRKT